MSGCINIRHELPKIKVVDGFVNDGEDTNIEFGEDCVFLKKEQAEKLYEKLGEYLKKENENENNK